MKEHVNLCPDHREEMPMILRSASISVDIYLYLMREKLRKSITSL